MIYALLSCSCVIAIACIIAFLNKINGDISKRWIYNSGEWAVFEAVYVLSIVSGVNGVLSGSQNSGVYV